MKNSSNRKGIVLAGGSGTRLYPCTIAVSKQLMPIYDKPMIYYPISLLMLAGIRDILIISTPQDTPLFERMLGDGSQFGVTFSYEVQPKPEGLAQAFLIGESFLGGSPAVLVLGDNLFYGHDLVSTLRAADGQSEGATIFGYQVANPSEYGVVEFEKSGRVISIEEKPSNPKSNYAVSGLYFYPNDVINIAKNQKPSSRGELEISDTNKIYLSEKRLKVKKLGRGYAWLDTGTHDSLLEASQFVQILEKRQGVKISCIEEIAFRMNYIDRESLFKLGDKMKNNSYGQYLISVAENS